MGLVMQHNMIDDFFGRFTVTDGVKTDIMKNGVKHAAVMEYPAQGEYTEAIRFIMIEKPFIEFAAACGPKGAMTKEMIVAEYPELADDIAKMVADDFAVAYGNYVIIPEGVTLFLSMPPLNSVTDLEKREDPEVVEGDVQ